MLGIPHWTLDSKCEIMYIIVQNMLYRIGLCNFMLSSPHWTLDSKSESMYIIVQNMLYLLGLCNFMIGVRLLPTFYQIEKTIVSFILFQI